MIDRTLALLLIGYAGATAWIAYEWQRPPVSTEMPEAPPAGKIPALAVPEPFTADRSVFNEISERPLFVQGRRPPQPQTDVIQTTPQRPAIPQKDEFDTVRLTAVLREADQFIALIEFADGKTEIVRNGERVGEWRIKAIFDDRLDAEQNGRTQTLRLHRFDLPPRSPIVRRTPAQAMAEARAEARAQDPRVRQRPIPGMPEADRVPPALPEGAEPQ